MINSLLKQPFKLTLIVIIIIGIATRFVNLDAKIYWKDEVFTSLRVSGYTEEDVKESIYNKPIVSLEDLQNYQQTRFFNNPIGTVYGLAKEEAQLPPLYFLMVKLWVSLFGNSIIVTRSLSAILSVIACLIIYLLCRELFELKMVAWIAMAMLSVSPFYTVYSQEARPYSLWLLSSLLSSWILLKALKFGKKIHWRFYSLAIILGLYTSPFSLFLNLGQGVYVIFREKLKITHIVKKYLISFLIGILGFSPWLFIIVLRYHQIKGRTNWSSTRYSNGLIELVFTWFRNIARIFVDFDQLNTSFDYTFQNPLFYLITVIPISILLGYSIYYLCTKTSKLTWSFIILWILSTALPLILADIILGGRRSGTARYLLPCYLGLQIALAYCLATKIFNSTMAWKTKIWQGITISLCFIGLLSSIYTSSKFLWWNNDPSRYYQNSIVIPIINKSSNSLVISDRTWDKVVTLSYSLSDDVKYQLVNSYNKLQLPNNFDHYFLYKPSNKLQERFKNNDIYQLKPAYKSDNPWLWIIEKKS